MPAICATCGAQFGGAAPPQRCPICEDARQYVGRGGQRWTDLEGLRREHRVRLAEEEPGLLGIGIDPAFAIGQRALLVPSPGGNVLWDCIPLIDDAAVAAVREAGGVAHIAISHPHYYSAMVEWAHAFGAAIHLHAADRAWVMRPDPAIRHWSGETLPLAEGVTLVRCGGHFEGATVLHWAAGAEGRGALLSGDIIKVNPDLRTAAFMRSYPNLVPLSAAAVRRIVRAVEPFAWDRVHGAWWGDTIAAGARAAVAHSAERHVRAIAGSGAAGGWSRPARTG